MISECKYCSKTFTAKTYRKIFCSDRCKVAYNRESRGSCFYCGQMASTRDHVTPHSTMGLKHRKWSGIDYVNCCKECNTLLGASHPYSMIDRIEHLIEKFTKKHKLHKPIVQWDEDELAEVSTSMAKSIRAHVKAWNAKHERLTHMRLRRLYVYRIETDDDDADPEDEEWRKNWLETS